MFIAYVIVSIVFALMLAGSAWAKLIRNDRVVTGITGLGVPLRWFPILATCELAGSVGLLAGIAFAPLGIAAAIGVVLYFVGALIAHFRAGDKAIVPPLVFLMTAVAALCLRIVSM
ncbi:MAG TPA: DoxX family protein [Pseudonocardiaceae bacterium]|nr:DoxX family protein [Pseudonocardiaceae bacterium]